MQREQTTDPKQSSDGSVQREPRTHHKLLGSEELHIRSYDHQWSYDLDVELVTDEGAVAFREQYYVPPGHTKSEAGMAPHGDYELRVTLDNSRVKTFDCTIGSSPEHTAVIEIGNGAITLTEGL